MAIFYCLCVYTEYSFTDVQLMLWLLYVFAACIVRWWGRVSQQPVGPVTRPAGPGGGALPAARAQCGRLASLLQHGGVQPGGIQLPLKLQSAASLLHYLHLWLVSVDSVGLLRRKGGKRLISELMDFMFAVTLRYEMQEAGVALDSAMKNFSLLQYSA